jgi:hypothetical protein
MHILLISNSKVGQKGREKWGFQISPIHEEDIAVAFAAYLYHANNIEGSELAYLVSIKTQSSNKGTCAAFASQKDHIQLQPYRDMGTVQKWITPRSEVALNCQSILLQ